jgi:hypothetical protein
MLKGKEGCSRTQFVDKRVSKLYNFANESSKGCEEDKYTPARRYREREALRNRTLAGMEWTSELQGERNSK